MSGVVLNNVTTYPKSTISVERTGSDEIFRRFVLASGARATAGKQPFGVCPIRSSTAGDIVPVDYFGPSLVEAGAAIVLADGMKAIMPDAQGRAIAHAGAVPVAGFALQAAASAGDMVLAIIIPIPA